MASTLNAFKKVKTVNPILRKRQGVFFDELFKIKAAFLNEAFGHEISFVGPK